MGVLGNQPSREDYRVSHEFLDAWLDDAVALAKKHGISVEAVIAAKRVLEQDRRNSMDSLAGDYHDEHMGGFGNILRDVGESLSRIADALERLKD